MINSHVVTNYKKRRLLDILTLDSSHGKQSDVLVNLGDEHHLAGDVNVRNEVRRKLLSHFVYRFSSQDYALTGYAFFFVDYHRLGLVLAHYVCNRESPSKFHK